MNTYTIRVPEADTAFPCREDQCVFEAMKQAGGPLTYGCFGGGCGACRMRVTAGDYQVFQRMSRAHVTPADEAQGVLLLCCIQPRSDLVLQTVPKDSPTEESSSNEYAVSTH